MKPIVLVGFMGSGKSAVARELGPKLQRSVVDLDADVERKAGMKISEIFETHGEESFRKIESEELAKAIAKGDVIIACGGGVVLARQNREALCESTVIYLRAKPETLVARVGDTNHRPLFKAHAINELLEEREHLYAEVADVIVDTDELSPVEVADRIAREAT
ncbi:MAG: shikimate kinase [Actinomycetota bacterium]